jgi:hypothetical protein
VQHFAVHGTFISVNHGPNLFEKSARQKKWSWSGDNCNPKPLSTQWKEQRMLAHERLMIAKPKGELTWCPSDLRSDLVRKTLQKFCHLIATDNSL